MTYEAAAETDIEKEFIKGWENHHLWSHTRFFEVMNTVFRTAEAKLKDRVVDFDEYLTKSPKDAFYFGLDYSELVTKIENLKEATVKLGLTLKPTPADKSKHKKYVKEIKRRILSATANSEDRIFVKEIIRRADQNNDCESLGMFFEELLKRHFKGTRIIQEAVAHGYGKRPRDENPKVSAHGQKDKKGRDEKKHREEKRERPEKIKTVDATTEPKAKIPFCDGCGGPSHTIATCGFKDKHPDFNSSGKSWTESEAGKACASHQMERLAWHKRADGSAFQRPQVLNEKKEDRKRKFDKGNTLAPTFCATCITHDETCDTCEYSVPSQKEFTNLYSVTILGQTKETEVTALIDTGARSANYVNKRTLEWLIANGAEVVVTASKRVCTAFNNCRQVNQIVELTISYNNLITGLMDKISFDVIPLETHYDLIIGLQTIGQFALTHTMLGINAVSRITPLIRSYSKTSSLRGRENEYPSDIDCTLCTLKAGTMSKDMFFDPEPVAEEIDESPSIQLEDILPADKDDETNAQVPIENIVGPETLQERIRALLEKHKDYLSKKVRGTAANVTPMCLVVNHDDWKIPASRLAPRPQSTSKLTALKEFITELLRLGVIYVSREVNASQVLLVQKPGGKALRFCIDYRELNKHTKSEGGVIPNIQEMLRRLGERKSKYFAVLDLTSGYHQAPLDPDARKFTAFTTFMGVYEWARVPMGLKNACNYFQRIMSTEVLAGLIYSICEVYLDDIIVFGNTEDEFIERLEQVFTRLREKNITLNPTKCKFGMETIQYVGHTINAEGMSFTRDKLDRVANFPRPEKQRELKSFLGLVNYFHAHIRDHSSVSAPLNKLVHDYQPSVKVKWNPEANTAFENLRDMIDNCPTLFFLDPNASIYLHTDASEFGLGAYLFQIVIENGVEIEKPVEFISKAFSPVQLRWSIPEKEAYAIFYSVRKLDYLLRDVHFVLRTYHKTLCT